ncbi:MAG: hypothetical protein VYD12_20380 [Pseudomonadota bacterium]|nr:hypothetical protein [Pseudomonadota bacterium]
MKAWMIFALLPTLSWAKQGPFLETGAGIEYGGFGAQVVLPTPHQITRNVCGDRISG